MATSPLSRWTLPILRVSMGLFLVAWGLDKLIATEGSVGIFSHFYGVDVGTLAVHAFGAAEVALGIVVAVGALPVAAAWLQLLVNTVSTVASWRQILDPWGLLGWTEGGTHLFLASIVIMGVALVLVVEAHARRRHGTETGEAA